MINPVVGMKLKYVGACQSCKDRTGVISEVAGEFATITYDNVSDICGSRDVWDLNYSLTSKVFGDAYIEIPEKKQIL